MLTRRTTRRHNSIIPRSLAPTKTTQGLTFLERGQQPSTTKSKPETKFKTWSHESTKSHQQPSKGQILAPLTYLIGKATAHPRLFSTQKTHSPKHQPNQNPRNLKYPANRNTQHQQSQNRRADISPYAHPSTSYEPHQKA